MSASNVKWVCIGEYIELCDERNSEGKYTLDDVRGISIQKKLIPTKADMKDVVLTPYKLLKPREFCYVTVTSRNGGKISLAINDTADTYIVSSSYINFRSKNTNDLLPEYLYLLLSRSEFDRYSRFNSWGSARETFDWEELCRIEIPLPSIEVQRELVATYNGLKALAEQNEALIEPLSKACEAFIVNCKKQYPIVGLGEYIEEIIEKNTENLFSVDDVRGVSIQKIFIPTKANMENVPVSSYKLAKPNQFAANPNTARMGDKVSIALNNSHSTYLVSSIYPVFQIKDEKKIFLDSQYLYLWFKRDDFDRYVRFNSWGSARETFNYVDYEQVYIPLPPIDVQLSIVNLYKCLEEAQKIADEAREKMKTLCPALIQKAANA